MGATVGKIEYSDIEFHEQVGEGGFGWVKRVTFKKPYKGYKEAAAKGVSNIREDEVIIMSKLNHPNIIKLLGFCRTGIADIILMEYASDGSLHDYLSDQSKPLPYELKKKWARESALAIQYLHVRNFLHRDIKPQNGLLFKDNLLKLCDFGLARQIDRSQTTSSQKGTYRYMAPEIHVGNERGRAVYSKPADIYAYGMLILEICSRKPPFDELEWQTVVFLVGNGTKPTIPDDCPQDLLDIIRSCWNANPKQRPTIRSIVEALNIWSLKKTIHPKYQGRSLGAHRIACYPNRDMVVSGWDDVYIFDTVYEDYKMSLITYETDLNKQIEYVYGITISQEGYALVVDDTKYVKVFDVKGKYLHCFKVIRDDHNTDVRLWCVAVDNDDQILVADRTSNQISIHKCPDGKVIKKIEYKMAANGSIVVNSKKQILHHFNPEDSVYSKVVAIDYSGNEVFTFTPRIDEDVTGKEVWAQGIVCDVYDNIYLAMQVSLHDNTGHIHKYSPVGVLMQCVAKGLEWPQDMSIKADGSLVVANKESILVYSSS